MVLKGKIPEESNQRLRLLLFGPAGVGKTTAAITQLPKPYVIDAEDGTRHYGDELRKAGGAVLNTVSMTEAMEEIRLLATEKHDYRTLVIDPFTILYDTELERQEQIVGTDFGRHYGAAGKTAKRFCSLINQLDMNICVTAHAKNEYGDQMKVTGQTFDGWKRLDYLFDLVVFLDRHKTDKTKRVALVKKTRLKQFPDQELFVWAYDEIAKRFGADNLEREAQSVKLAGEDVIDKFKALYAKLSEAEIKRLKIDKVISNIDEINDLPEARVVKGIEQMQKHLGGK